MVASRSTPASGCGSNGLQICSRLARAGPARRQGLLALHGTTHVASPSQTMTVQQHLHRHDFDCRADCPCCGPGLEPADTFPLMLSAEAQRRWRSWHRASKLEYFGRVLAKRSEACAPHLTGSYWLHRTVSAREAEMPLRKAGPPCRSVFGGSPQTPGHRIRPVFWITELLEDGFDTGPCHGPVSAWQGRDSL